MMRHLRDGDGAGEVVDLFGHGIAGTAREVAAEDRTSRIHPLVPYLDKHRDAPCILGYAPWALPAGSGGRRSGR